MRGVTWVVHTRVIILNKGPRETPTLYGFVIQPDAWMLKLTENLDFEVD